MTEQELDRLASMIATALQKSARGAAPAETGGTWLPTPVRPEPSPRGGEPPLWSGAAQSLHDGTGTTSDRPTTGEMTNATRAAAAGRGRAPQLPARARAPQGPRGSARGQLSIAVPIGVSNRHIHLSPAHFQRLFGTTTPTVSRTITQPGQFAANETVEASGPSGKIPGIRIVGPNRGETQLEISLADARRLGVTPVIANSGKLANSGGGVTITGPAGSVTLDKGVIVAARHLHLAPADAGKFGLRDGDVIDVRVGEGSRATTFHGALVRSGSAHATEFHLDADEAHAAGVRTGDKAIIVARASSGARRKRLITEGDVVRLASSGGAIPADSILTPSARDRARALGLVE
jgi:putative phosphotransacetylase